MDALMIELTDGAAAHGEADGKDSEIGDLKQLLARCWEKMTPAMRRAVFEASHDVRDWAI